MKVLIFHGTMGTPQGNWFPWLQENLMMQGWQVAVPTLPTPEDQSLDNWKKALEEQVPSFQEADVLIGHSLGATFILNVLEDNLIQPKQAVLVSSVTQKIGIEEYDKLNHSFIKDGFDWGTIKQTGTEIKILHGDDDPYVPLSHAQQLSQNLDAPLDTIKDGAHLNAENGYTEFPYLLDILND